MSLDSRKRHANEDRRGGLRKVGRKLDDNRFVNHTFLLFLFRTIDSISFEDNLHYRFIDTEIAS